MSLIDDLGKQVLGKLFGGEQGASGNTNWLQLAAALVMQQGGLQGLVEKFKNEGLGDMIASWVSTGPNPPISAEQIKLVLGSVLPDLAKQAGTDTNTAANGLAQVLPGLVDQLTPNGESVEGDALQQGLKAVLGGDLSKIFG
jgi:uncharacterized protein YidB (DUF937 family)